MANEERREDDIFIKEKRRAKNFFVTSSAKMDNDKITNTTISSSHFTEMSKSFADGDHLVDDGVRELSGGIIYMLQEMQHDIDDVYNEVSASSFQASFFPFATINSASIGYVSSSLVPDKDGIHHLGASGKEWQNLFVDGTANIDSLAMGTTVTSIKDEDNMSSDDNAALATQQSIKAYVDANGGGTIDSSLTNGSTNAVQNNAVFDGLATKLNLSGGKMTGLIQPIYVQTKTITKNNVDVRAVNVLEIAQKQAWTLTTATPAFIGQQLQIISATAGTITHTNASGKAPGTFCFSRSRNQTTTAGAAYFYVADANLQWRSPY
jgi:hypothetical protein